MAFRKTYNLRILINFMKKDVWTLRTLWVIITTLAILHLIRATMWWFMNVEGFGIPIWLSYVSFLVLGYLSYKLFMSLRR